MALQVNAEYDRDLGGLRMQVLEGKLITSGTTVAYTIPGAAGKRILNAHFHNETNGDLNATAAGTQWGDYAIATGIWTSPAMSVNDLFTATFIIVN